MYEISEELSGSLRKLNSLEIAQLEANCVADGRILAPIVVWNGFVMDGRHRLEIAEKHGLEYDTVELNLQGMEEAKEWVALNQLGRRNSTEYEMQRLRAEQAKEAGDTAVVAEAHGVSRRTVQRDVELVDALNLMSDDVRAKCEAGSIIAGRSDWKKYASLTDEQRSVTDATLRKSPELTLRQAIPSKDVRLKPEDFKVLNAMQCMDRHRQALSLGKLYADHDSVQKLAALSDEAQLLVSEILADPDCGGLDEALLTLKAGGMKLPPDNAQKLSKVNKTLGRELDKVGKLLDDRRVLMSDQSGHQPCMEALNALRERIASWR